MKSKVMNSALKEALHRIIDGKIHSAKSKVHDKLPTEVWQAIDSRKIAEESLVEIMKIIEAWMFIPCCHVSGLHDPEHFEKRMICFDQMAEAFIRFCNDAGIDPVVRSKNDCYWCTHYLHYRIGEGVRLSDDIKRRKSFPTARSARWSGWGPG